MKGLSYRLILCGLVAASYANSLGNGFASDSRYFIEDDERVHSATPQHLGQIFTETYWWPQAESGLYRPLTTLSYLANYLLLRNGANPAGFHWTNFALHLAAVCLFFELAELLMEARAPAFFAAALWAVHPINTEAVTNVVGRADELAALAVLGALLLYIRRNRLWMLVAAAGFLAKESAVVVFGLMLLYDLAWRPKEIRWRNYAWMIPPLAVIWGTHWLIFHDRVTAEFPFVDNPLVGASFWTARWTAVKVLGKLLWLWVWPARLSCDYSYNQIPMAPWWDWRAGVSLAVLCGLLAAALLLYRRRQRAAFFFVLFFFVSIAPTSNVFVLIGSIMAERFLYLPGMALAACAALVAFAIGRRWKAWRAVPLLLGLCVLAGCARTVVRNRDWRDEEHLWRAALPVVPNSFKVYQSLAYTAFRKDPGGTYIEQAIETGEKALEIVSHLPDRYRPTLPYTHMGIYYRVRGDQFGSHAADGRVLPGPGSLASYRKSLEVLQRGVEVDRAGAAVERQAELQRGTPPDKVLEFGYPPLYGALALTWMRLGDMRQALAAVRRWQVLDPFDSQPYCTRRDIDLMTGQKRDAGVAMMEMLTVNDSPATVAEAIRTYQYIAPGSCAVGGEGEQFGIKLDCALVRADLCAGLPELRGVFREARREKWVGIVGNTERRYGCGK